MNTSTSLPEQRFLQAAGHRVVAEPDPEQRTVKILADDGLALRLALRAGQSEHVGCTRSFLREIEPGNVHLEESLGAQPRAVEHQLARAEPDSFVDLHARHLRG